MSAESLTMEPDSRRRRMRWRTRCARSARARRIAAAALGARAGRGQDRGACTRPHGGARRRGRRSSPPTRRDMAAAEARRSPPALLDRLLLDDKRVEAMAAGLEAMAALPDPIGTELARWTRPNGLDIARVRIRSASSASSMNRGPTSPPTPAACACASGNAVILRGGSESFHSSRAIVAALRRGASRGRACPTTRCSSCRRATARRSA